MRWSLVENLFIIISANVVIIGLFFYSKIYIALKYQRDGSDDYIAIDVYMFRRLLAYSMQVPMIEIGDFKKSLWPKSKIKAGQRQDETHSKREQRFIKKTVKFYLLHPSKLRRVVKLGRYYIRFYCKFMDKFTHMLHCEELRWKTVYGSEDAALTGIGIGMLWTIKALMITRLKKHVIVTKTPIINVNPLFGHNSLKVDFKCIFSIRFGNVIDAVRILYNIKVKGGE